jgi:hypothetical protein
MGFEVIQIGQVAGEQKDFETRLERHRAVGIAVETETDS